MISKRGYFLVISILFPILISLLQNFALVMTLELLCIFIGNYYYRLNLKEICALSLLLDFAHLDTLGLRAIPMICGFALSEKLNFNMDGMNFYFKLIVFITTSYFGIELFAWLLG